MAFPKSSSPNHRETYDLLLRDTIAIDHIRLAN